MATSMPEGLFLGQDQLIDDVLEYIQKDTPEAQDLRAMLKITSNCDFPAQLVAQLSNPSSTLRKYIQENFHPNQGVSTLGTASRIFFNETNVEVGQTQNAVLRVESNPNVFLQLKETQVLNSHVHVKDPGFTISNNRVIFNRVANYVIMLQLRLALFQGSGALSESPAPSWRFSDTQANRSLSVQPFLRLYGSLAGGVPYYDVMMQPVTITQEMAEAQEPLTVGLRAVFKALTGSDTYGRIESFQVGLERGNTIAYYGIKPDAVGLIKATPKGQADTYNFLDLVEI